MIVELLVLDAETNTLRPVRIVATQVVVRNGSETPILAVAADYGTSRSQIVAHVGDKDFNEALKKLGVLDSVTVGRIQLPAPSPGARLIHSPKIHGGDNSDG